jgi:hypothetical protein
MQQRFERFAEDLLPVRELDHPRFDGAMHQEVFERAFVLDERLAASALGAEEWRLCDEDVTGFDQRRHLPVEERQQQRADMRPVDIGVGHDDHAVVTEFREIEILRSDTAAERRDHGLDLFTAQHLVEARLFDVEDLAANGQDRLEPSIAALLCRAPG